MWCLNIKASCNCMYMLRFGICYGFNMRVSEAWIEMDYVKYGCYCECREEGIILEVGLNCVYRKC